jgi:hypothetical protein
MNPDAIKRASWYHRGRKSCNRSTASRLNLWASGGDRSGCTMVETRAYRPARNIFAGLRGWPKTSLDSPLRETRFTGTGRCPTTPAGVDPFRPGRIHHIMRRRAWRAVPASRGNSRASTPLDYPSTLSVPLQLGQIIERIGAVQLAGVDQTHSGIGLHRVIHLEMTRL